MYDVFSFTGRNLLCVDCVRGNLAVWLQPDGGVGRELLLHVHQLNQQD